MQELLGHKLENKNDKQSSKTNINKISVAAEGNTNININNQTTAISLDQKSALQKHK